MNPAIDFGLGVLRASWGILNDSAPYVLLGFIAAAIIRAVIPDRLVRRHLGRSGNGGVVKAALFGIPIPLCSCGVLPAAIGLRKQGAGRGATMSFLISTPETGVDSIAITWALMDPIMTVFRPIAAFVTAITAGFLENSFVKGITAAPDRITPASTAPVACECAEGCQAALPTPNAHEPFRDRILESLDYTFGEFLADIGRWLLVGIVLAGIVAHILPPGFFETHLGRGIMPMLIMLVAGVPLYICATSSTPFAAALVLKGLSPGAALVFLLAGPATNAATMAVVLRTLGAKSLAIYLGSIAVCALALGYVLDFIYGALGFSLVPAMGMSGENHVGWFAISCSILLLALVARSLNVERCRNRKSSEIRRKKR